MAEPVQLSPAEVAEYEKLAGGSAPQAVSPLRDFSADELFDLSVKDKDNFDLVSEFRRNKDLWQDPNVVQKVAEVHSRIKQRGFSVSDIPGPKKIAESVFGIAKGLGKQAWNYANALVGVPIASAIGEVTGDADQPGFNTELAQEGERRVMENIAGTESAGFGLARMAQKAVNKIGRATGLQKPLDQYTPEEKIQDLWSDVGSGEAEEEITKGKGGFLTPIGANVRKDLEAAGKPVRPEEVAQTAAGDPLSFYTFGKVFQGAGKLVPAKVAVTADQIVSKAGDVAEAAAGRAIQGAGKLSELGGKAVKVLGPAVGMIKGAMEAGPLGALAGLKGGEIAAKVGGKMAKAGQRMSVRGEEIAGAAPVMGAKTQLVKDLAGSVPMAATEIGKGAAFDVGTAAVSSESPQDTQSVGIGAFFGAMGAAQRGGKRVLSGQIVGPRAWGADKAIPSSGQNPTLDAMHSSAIQTAEPAVKTRLNAIREFVKGVNPNADVYLAKDAASLEQALISLGVDPAQAKTTSEAQGFFDTTLPGKDGKPRRTIILREVDAAPHEAFHAIQDVLGEGANQHIDALVRQEYAPQWEQEGQRYADRIEPAQGRDWREVILDSTGTGLDFVKEKIALAVGNEYRATTGAEPQPGFVQERVKAILGQVMDQAVQANPSIDPNAIARHIWRDVLTAEEASAVADTYLARELAAENFDMVFKNQGGTQLTQKLARIVAGLVSKLGGEPLSPEVVSQAGKVAPKFRVAEAVKDISDSIQPIAVEKPAKPTVTPKAPSVPSSEPSDTSTTPAAPADEARTIAESAPETPVAGGTQTQREILGHVAESIAQQAGIKINYLSAPDEPAAATTSNREARRAIIETYRTMPAEARALWEKNFFPERVLKLKGDKYQIMGWSPEVFAANAHKLAAKLTELGVAEASPYAIKDNTFTPEGWTELFADTQKFVKNQMAGRTGAGEELVVPKDLTDRGMFAPPKRGAVEGLDQTKADFVNMLFNFRLPDTARVQKGKLPLNIAGQDISEATKPGRTEIPVIPRGKFEGAEAERQGIAGREVKEVNPLRQQIEAAAQAQGKAMPEFIEAIQRLNLENIKEVQITPEQPQFRGNTLTLSAGFQPQTAKGKELVSKGYELEEFGYRGTRGIRINKDGQTVADISSAMLNPKKPNSAEVDMVHVRDDLQGQGLGETLYRELAARLQKDGVTELTGTAISDAPLGVRTKVFGDFPEIQSVQDLGEGRISTKIASKIDPSARFQPKSPEEVKTPEDAKAAAEAIASMGHTDFFRWAQETSGFTPIAHEVGLKAPSAEFVGFLEAAKDGFQARAMDLIKEGGDIQQGVNVAAQAQFFREAWEAATGEGSAGYYFKKENPNYVPPFPKNKSEKSQNSVDIGSQDATMGSEMSTKLQPKTADEYKLKPAKSEWSKAWILPNGKPVQLGGQWHHDFINASPEIRSKYGLDETDNTELNRISALKKGFVRVNWNQRNGQLTVEAREKDWRKQRESVRKLVDASAGDIDAIRVILFDDNIKSINQDETVQTFRLDDEEKAAHLPFLDLAGDKRATGDASDRLFNRAVEAASKKQLQPRETPPTDKEYIKTAAVRFPSGRVVTAQYHEEAIDEAAYKHGIEDEPEAKGFVTSKGRFVDRFEAMKIAKAAKQVDPAEFLNPNSRALHTFDFEGTRKFQPATVKEVAEDYAKKSGREYAANKFNATDVNPDTAKEVADFYEAAKHDPDAPEVKQSYDALAKETLDQYAAIKDAGYTIEPWDGKGEPYASSADMVKDVNENKHLYFLKTDGNFEGSESNHMLQEGPDGLLVNDIFRAVHDFFGHAKENLQFGPKGEFNAWRVHSEMYSPEAQGALAAETLAQNFWVNYGKQLRRKDGSVPKRGDSDFVPLKDRQFAEQKNVVIPDEFLERVRRFQPAVAEKFSSESFADELKKIRTGQAGGQTFTPDGEVWNPGDKKLDIVTVASVNVSPKDLTPEKVAEALEPYADLLDQPGVVAGVFSFSKDGKPTVSIDVNATVPQEFREHSADFAEANDQVAIWDAVKNEEVPTGGKGNTRLKSVSEISDAIFELQRGEGVDVDEIIRQNGGTVEEEQTTLFGHKDALTSRQVSDMTRAQVKKHFPEAVVPQNLRESIPSRITESPLFKQAGSEDKAVEAFARRLADFAKEHKDHPVYKAGVEWYDKFTPMLKEAFGEDANLMAELLAATSPQTNVETNFAYALDALESFKSGRFTKIMSKFNQGLDMLNDGRWEAWYNRENNAGKIPNPPKEPTPAAFLEHWIFKHGLKPTQTNGKLYGQHSLPVLQVFARKWLDTNKGPKTANFVENLLGKSHEATIDLWADRTMRRIGYAGQDRWRILPKNATGVTDTDFAFSQKAFRRAAEMLGIKPSALQGGLWFAEKQLWSDNGWSRLDLGDFRNEMKKLPLLRAGIKQRLTTRKLSDKVKPTEAMNLDLIEPRTVRAE